VSYLGFQLAADHNPPPHLTPTVVRSEHTVVPWGALLHRELAKAGIEPRHELTAAYGAMLM
jgi:hypothetical protein